MRMAIPYSRTLLGPLQWYSVLIVTGILVAIWLAGREERRLGLPRDTVIDLALIVIPCGIIGARLYYVAMTWELFRDNPVSILYIWEGGIAIYGGVIGGALGDMGIRPQKEAALPQTYGYGRAGAAAGAGYRPVGQLFQHGGLRSRNHRSGISVFSLWAC